MTTSGKKFLEEQEQDTVKILSNSPDQTIRASRLAEIQKLQNPPQGTISAVTPEQQRSLKIGSLKKSISDRLAYPKKLLSNGLESAKGILKMSEQAIGEAYTEGMHKFVYRNTRNIDEDRSQNYEQVKKDEKEIKSFAKPILEKNDETQGLIEEAKTGKTNIFSFAYKNSAEYGAGSSINTIFPNQWVDVNENTVYFANSKTTVSKPVLKNSLKFGTSKLLDVYNSITYNFQHNGDVYSVEDIKTYVPEWQDVPDGVIQQFIYDALSDVQTGERRDIDLYAEYYPALSNGDKYVNQKDALLQLLTDENFRNRGLADYLEIPTEDGETIAPQKLINGKIGGQDLMNLLDAAMTIKAGATILNEGGANITQATDYAIAKSYADQYPLVKEALKLFDSRDLSIEDFDKLVENYNANIGSINREYQSYGGDNEMTLAQLEAKVDEILWSNMRRDNDAFLNSWNKERLQGKYWYAGEGKIDSYILGLQDAYRADDGKWYDKNGNEVEETEMRRGIIGRYLNLLMDMGQTTNVLSHEWDMVDEDPTKEAVVNVISDNVILYFDLWNFSKGGMKFNLKTQIPFLGPIYEKLIGAINEVSGESILGLANMTLFADGEWTEESQQKFKESAGGLVSIYVLGAIERAKGHIKAELKKDYYQSAFKKALDSYTTELTKGLEVIDVEAEKEKIIKQNQPEPVEGENQKEVEKTEQTRKVQRVIFLRGVLDRALSSFNKTFEEELQKNAGEGYKPSIVDYLWNMATRLANRKDGKTTDEILEEGIEKVENKKSENDAKIEELEKRKSELQDKDRTPEEKVELDRINEEIENLKKENEELTKRQDTTRETQSEEYREKKEELDQKKADLETTKQQREELNKQLVDINNQIINARGEGNTELVKELTEQKKDTKKQLEDVDRTIKNLERDIRTMEGNGTFRDMIEDIKQGAREAYEETKDAFKKDETEQEITTPESPEVKVEETKTGAPAETEGTVKTETKAPDETRTVINQILDVIQKIQDNARAMYEKFHKNKEQKKLEKEMDEIDEMEETMVREEQTLTPKQFKTILDNPFTDIIMRIANKLVGVRENKKGEPEMTWKEGEEGADSKDKIQRDVLSEGITRIQQFVDRIKSLKKRIGELYDKLSSEKTIRTRDFVNGEEFQQLLRENGLEYVEYIDENTGKIERHVVADDGRVLGPKERAVVKYLENMIDLILEKSMISERDAHKTRQNLTAESDWTKDSNFPKAMKRELYNAWNKFLERNGKSDMMRKLDEGFSELSENLDTLSELLDKNDEVKNNAKNTILNWDKETIDQMNKMFPGIDKLIELTKESKGIVDKVVASKLKYRQTNKFLGKWGRYLPVMLGSGLAGLVPGGLLIRSVVGSLVFISLEVAGNALKKKISKQVPDREQYNKLVDLLQVDNNKKTSLKEEMRALYDTMSELADLKTDVEMEAIMDEATQILIQRQAKKIKERKEYEQANAERKEEIERQREQTDSELNDLKWDIRKNPLDNALPSPTPDTVGPDGTVTLGRGNPISPEQATKKPNLRKPIKEVKETYADKEKTQQGYTRDEEMTMQAALGAEKTETHSPEAEKVANAMEKVVDSTASAVEEDATNKVIEKGEELTDENIQKEINKEESSMDDFFEAINSEPSYSSDHPGYDGADIKVLEEVVNNPDKYPNVDHGAAERALEKANRQNMEADIMQSPDQQQAQKEIAGIYKANQMELEHDKGREKQREDMVTETNRDFDTLETTEEYDRIENQVTPEKGEMALKYSKGYKGYYRSNKEATDLLLEDMGKGPSQNITWTSSSDKIATLRNPKSKKRVAQERIDKKVDPNIKKAKTDKTRDKWIEERVALDKIIEEADTQLEAQRALLEQKKELLRQREALKKKRDKTPYPETKKEITKKIEKIEEEFENLDKPKEVEDMEVDQFVKEQEYNKAMDKNETPQKTEPEMEKQETKKESEGERSFGDDKFTERNNKTEEMSKDENITIKDTVNEVEEIVGGGIKDYQEKTYGERRDKEETYTNDGAESFRNEVNNKIRERDNKFWENQRSKTKDMESTKLTKEQEKQLEEAKTKEEKDALMNKWRKEYIERNPIAEERLKEAEEHNEQFQKAMNALDKLNAIMRRIRRKNAEKIDRAYEERKKKRAEEERKEKEMMLTAEEDAILQGTEKDAYEEKETEMGKSMNELENLQKEVKNNKKEPKKEEPKKEVETKQEKDEPLVKVENDGSVYKEPFLGDLKTRDIEKRIEFLKNKFKEQGNKLYMKQEVEYKILKDLLKRQKERENREEGSAELSERQREILNGKTYGDIQREIK